MSYQRFEEIPVWQQSRKFVNTIYQITRSKFQRDYSLIDQFRRAAVSIILNIAEGFERKTNKEFAQYINIAKGSAGESRAVLYIAKDLSYISELEFNTLLQDVESISRQLAKFAKFLLES